MDEKPNNIESVRFLEDIKKHYKLDPSKELIIYALYRLGEYYIEKDEQCCSNCETKLPLHRQGLGTLCEWCECEIELEEDGYYLDNGEQ